MALRGREAARVLAGAIVIATLVASASSTAHAQGEGSNAAAESLFQEARKLMDARRYAEACAKFAASQKLAPGPGTLLNLANCYEKDGKVASAWARYHEAVGLAQRLGRPDREKTAKEGADRLEPRLIKLTIVSDAVGVDVKLDGNLLDRAVIGTALPVDPGKHTIEAMAKGKKSFVTTLDVSERTKNPSVQIPALEEDTTSQKPDPPKPPPDKIIEPPKEEKPGWGAQKIVGVVGMGVGVVGLGVGAFFGLRASSRWSDAKPRCPNLECDKQGIDLAADAKSAGNLSTIFFIAGGLVAAGGAVLFFTAPSRERAQDTTQRVRVGIGPGSVVVGGSF
jgi:hypothetical protein